MFAYLFSFPWVYLMMLGILSGSFGFCIEQTVIALEEFKKKISETDHFMLNYVAWITASTAMGEAT